MKNNVVFIALILFGFSMFVNGCKNIIDFQALPFKSMAYNLGHYCGIFCRSITGIYVMKFGIERLQITKKLQF